MLVSIDLPIPPSTNNAYFNVPGCGRVASTTHRRWKMAAGLIVNAAHLPEITGPYHFTILLPMGMRGDVSNRQKLAEDLFVQLGITPDDRKARSTHQARSPEVKPGWCRIEIKQECE